MNEDLRNILREIETAMGEIRELYQRGPIYSSPNSIDDLGREAIYSRTLTNGIVLRLVNDASYSIGGDATEEQKRAFITSLQELINDNSGEVSQEIKDAIYPIMDAVELSIEDPQRDAEIQDIERTQGEGQEEQEEGQDQDENNGSDGKGEGESGDEGKGEEEGENENPESVAFRKSLEDDISLFSEIKTDLTKVRDEYQTRKDGAKSEEERTNTMVFLISTGILLDNLEELNKRVNDALKYSNETGKIPEIDYSRDLKDILSRLKKEYEKLSKDSFKDIDPKTKTAFDELMKKVEARMKLLGIDESKDNGKGESEDEEKDGSESGDEGKDNEEGNPDDEKENDEEDQGKPDPGKKGLTIVFNAKTGKYVLYDGQNVVSEVNPDDIFGTKEEDRILEMMQKENPDYDEKDLYEFIDPVVYAMLLGYDKTHKTNYSKDFINSVFDPKRYKMPVDLKYILSRKNNLDKDTYSQIKSFAKQYEKEKLATVENAGKDKDDDLDGKRGRGSLIESLKALGTIILTAIINLGYNIKDVVTRKKKFREILPPNTFKRLDSGDTKAFPKPKDKKENDKSKGEKSEGDKSDKTEYKGTKIGIRYKDGMYSLRTGSDLESEVRYGDIVITHIAVRDSEALKEKFKLSDEEMKHVDSTVYMALKALEKHKEYAGISDRYIEAARKGESLPELSVDYDLSTIDAVDEKYVPATEKARIKELAKEAQDKSRGKVVMPDKSVKPETAKKVNDDISKVFESPDYKKSRLYIPRKDEVYKKTDMDIARRINDILSESVSGKTLSEKEKRKEYFRVLVEMAKKRGIPIAEGQKISGKHLFNSIVIHDADELEKDSSYLMPEEKAKANRGRGKGNSSKGKKKERDGKRGTEK